MMGQSSQATWIEDEAGTQLMARLALLLEAKPARLRPVTGGYTPARRAVVELKNGTTAFCKLAVDATTAGWLRREHAVYRSLQAPFMPGFQAFEDGELPLLVLEDLSTARWTPPWRPSDVKAFVQTLEQVADASLALPLDTLKNAFAGVLDRGWAQVARLTLPAR